MHRHIIYIVNPISGTGNKGMVEQFIESRTKAAGISFSIYPSVASGDYSFLHQTIEEEKCTDVVIAAGDGTINGVINSLRNLDLQFGILPCGSGNGLAFGAHLPKNMTKALAIIFKGQSAWTDAFQVNDHFGCMICGLGLDAKVAHDFANDPARGLKTYIKKTIANFFAARPYSFEIITPEEKIITEAFFVSVANSNQFGNNFTIAPQAKLSDGLLDIVIVTRQSKISALVETIKQLGGFNTLIQKKIGDSNAAVLYFQTDSLKILNPASAPLHIDGDPVETAEVMDISIIKNCFRLIYP